MKTIKLTNKAYEDLLELKNHFSVKLRQVTNPETMKPEYNRYIDLLKINRKIDFEPEFSFSECLSMAIDSIWDEQKTGIVNGIT